MTEDDYGKAVVATAVGLLAMTLAFMFGALIYKMFEDGILHWAILWVFSGWVIGRFILNHMD